MALNESSLIYLSGEPILVGEDGSTAYVKSSGTPVYNEGTGTYVYESGLGIQTELNQDLLGWWQFDDESDTSTALDSIADVDGSVESPEFVNSDISGHALDFERGNNDTVEFGTQPYTESELKTHTFSMWVKPESSPNEEMNVFDHGDCPEMVITTSGEASYSMLFGDTFSDNVGVSVRGGSVPVGEWTLLSGTCDYDNSVMKLYVNDAQVDSATIPDKDPNLFGRPFRFGATYSDSTLRNYDGLLDDPRLWSRSLTDSDQQRLYDETKP